MEAINEQDIWQLAHHDRKLFLRSARLHHCIHDDLLLKEKGKIEAAQRCMNTLQAIVESLQYDHVMITDCMVFHRSLWDTKIYEDDPTTFPVSHVPIKCNIISTTIDLLRNYSATEISGEGKEKMWVTFSYLEKLLDATQISTHGESSTMMGTMLPAADMASSKRWSAQTFFSSVKRSNSRSKPRQAISGSKSINTSTTTPTASRMSISTSTSTAASIRSSITISTVVSNSKGTSNETKRPHLSRENINKFQEYKPLIIALYHRLKVIDQYDPGNDYIFEFINNVVCNFIVADCRIILLTYIERKVIQIQDQDISCI